MKIHLITDNKEIALGLRFSGISNEIVSDETSVKKALEKAISNSEIGIILITENVFNYCSEYVSKLKLLSRRRIILRIPDISNINSFENSISKRIKEILG